MRDEDQRAAVVDERVEQHFLRVEIEMVGRLVEQQRVRRPQQHARDRQARALAARQHAHRACRRRRRRTGSRRGCCGSSAPCASASPTASVSYTVGAGSIRVASSCAKYCMTTLWPSTRSPASGASSPESMRISVDLPAPFGPTSAMRSPRSMCRLRSVEDDEVAVRLAHVLQLEHRAAALARRPGS